MVRERKVIKAVAFDFGGTLFSTETMGQFTTEMEVNFRTKAVTDLGLAQEEAHDLYRRFIERWKRRRVDNVSRPDREINSMDMLSELVPQCTVDQKRRVLDAFHSAEGSSFPPLPFAVETLKDLSVRGIRIGIVSNNPWKASLCAALESAGVENLISTVVCSSEVGFRKPHRAMWDELLKRWPDLSPEEILFVGDSFHHDIEPAIRLGFMTCLVHLDGRNKNKQESFKDSVESYITDLRALLHLI